MSEARARQLRRALARAEQGKPLALDETEALLFARGEDLERLTALASRLRDLGHGEVVTYSRKVFIPLTMLCRDHCHYCTFAKPPARLDAPFLTPDQVPAGEKAGGRGRESEVCCPIRRAWLYSEPDRLVPDV